MQVGANRTLREAHAASRFLEHAVGLDVEADLDPGQPRGELVEGDDARCAPAPR